MSASSPVSAVPVAAPAPSPSALETEAQRSASFPVSAVPDPVAALALSPSALVGLEADPLADEGFGDGFDYPLPEEDQVLDESWNLQLLLQYLADSATGDLPSLAEQQDFGVVACEHFLARESGPG
jgi:hypothetical protein